MTKPTILLNMNWDNAEQSQPFFDVLSDYSLINWAAQNHDGIDLGEVTYAVVWNPAPGLLSKCDNLELIFSVGAGVDHIFRNGEVPDLPIVRFVDPDLTGPMVEWVVLQVLYHVRQQRLYNEQKKRHLWSEIPQPSSPQFRVGMMGFGELGQACAKVLKMLGFQINGWSQSRKSIEGISSFEGDSELGEFLSQTDILVNLLPLTEQTRGLIDAELIAKLSNEGPFKAPIFINAGRGGSHVEQDISAALTSGALYSASLDVFETEPLPHTSPLWTIPNLVITPHIAAISDPAALAKHVDRQINRWINNEPLEHLVDRKRGY